MARCLRILYGEPGVEVKGRLVRVNIQMKSFWRRVKFSVNHTAKETDMRAGSGLKSVLFNIRKHNSGNSAQCELYRVCFVSW
jgi:hypothetical protein